MKRILLSIVAMLILCIPLHAQTGPISQVVPFHELFGPMSSGAAAYCTPDLSGRPFSDYKVIYMFTNGAPSGVTMTFTGSTNGRTYSTITTGTNTAGDSVDLSGVYTSICVTATSITGSGVTVSGTITGLAPLGSVTVDTTGLATATNQTGGGQKTQLVDGSGNNYAGTAGTAATPVMSVQGKASMTPVAIAYSNGGVLASTDVAPVGGNASGTTTQFVNCDTPILYDTNTNGKTQLIALTSGKTIYVCGLSIINSTTTAVNVSFGSGTGSNCGSTYTAKTPVWVIPAQSSDFLEGFVLNMSAIPWFTTAASEELCISTSAGVSLQVLGMATKF